MLSIFGSILVILLVNYSDAEWCITLSNVPLLSWVGLGTYTTEKIKNDPSNCISECFIANKVYYGIWKSYCFCVNDLNGTTNATCTNSDITVGKAIPSDINTVYDINFNSLQMPTSTTPISFVPNIYLVDPPLAPYGFKYSYRDRFGIWENNPNLSPIQRVMNVPGVYELRSTSMKLFNNNTITVVNTEFSVYEKLANINLTCQPMGLVFKPINCTVSIESGSSLTGSILVDGTIMEDLTIPDVPWERAGSIPNFFNNNFINGLSLAGIHIVNSVFAYPGTISFIEINALKTVQIDVLLLRPDCANLYCFAESTCSSDETCNRKLTCPSNAYCSLSSSCSTNCNNRLLKSEQISKLPINYKIDKQTKITITKVGYQMINLGDQWPVKSGYRLAFHTAAEVDVIATTPVRNGEVVNFYSNSHAINIGETLSVSSFSVLNVTHQISTIAKPQRNIKFKLMINSTGLKKVSLQLKDVENKILTATASILMGLDINGTSINITAGLVGVPYLFNMNPHTGDNLLYYWDFGDSNTTNTTERKVNYIYKSIGVYNGSVIVYNIITAKKHYFIVRILERVVIDSFNGTVSSQPNDNVQFIVMLKSGNEFSCTLSGDQIQNITQPATKLTFIYKWSTEGYFRVRIDCFNELTTDNRTWYQAIFSNITGLVFDKLGGEYNVPSQMSFRWLMGINVTFDLLIDNVTRRTTSNEVTKTGLSEKFTINIMGIVVGVLRALNPMSDIIMAANLTYSERISGVKLIPDKLYVANGSSITFSVTMLTGSAVVANIFFADGKNISWTSSPFIRWVNNYSVPYLYAGPGNYNVTVNCSNIVNNEIASTMVYVIQFLGIYTIKANDLFLDKGQIVELSLVRSSGFPATMANITIDWKNGYIQEVPVALFNESAVYKYSYNRIGEYNVTMKLENPLGSVSNTVYLLVINPVLNFRCTPEPANTWSGNPMTMKTLIDGGDNVTITFLPGTTDPGQRKDLNVTVLNTPNDFSYSYATVGNYTQSVFACNPLGCKNCSHFIQIQYKILQPDFIVTTNGNVELNKAETVVTINFKGVNFPTALKATFVFSDNSPPEVVYLSQSMMPHQVRRYITVAGFGTVLVKLENLANAVNITEKFGVFEKFSNFNATVTWGLSKSSGFGPNKNTFPLYQALYFRPNPSTKGTVVGYTFLYMPIKNTSAVVQCNVTLLNGEFNYTFTQNGDFNVSLRAYNPIDMAYADFFLTFGGSIKDTKIFTEPEPVPPAYPGWLFVTWSVISTDACICINFANGTKLIYGATSGCANKTDYQYANIQPVNNQLKIRIKYMKEGSYDVSVHIFNGFESVVVNQTIAVTRKSCSRPVVSMKELSYLNSYTPQTEDRSAQIIVIAIITDIPCQLTKNNTKIWTAELVDPINFVTIKSVDLSSIPTRNNTYLIIPPRFLDYGIYLLTFTVTMDTTKTIIIFQSQNQTYLKIVKSPIVVGLVSGSVSLITRGFEENICFTPKQYSFDPDLNTQDFTKWTWSWTCRNSKETLNNNSMVYPKSENYNFPNPKTGCFGDGPGKVNFTDSACFSGKNMVINETYIMELQGSSPDQRNGSSNIKIHIVKGIPPNVSVQCLRPLMCKINTEGEYAYNELMINPSDDLLMSAICILSSGHTCLEGTWTIQYLNKSTKDWPPVAQEELQKHIKGIASLQMGLSRKFFEELKYERIEICYKSVGQSPDGGACIKFYVFPLPENITCVLDKNVVDQSEEVCCNCTFLPFHEYRIILKANTKEITLGLSTDGRFCSIIPYMEVPQRYSVQVSNKYGGFKKFHVGNVTVKPMSTNETNKILDDLNNGKDASLIMSIAKGDYKQMSLTYLKYMSVITDSNQKVMKALTNGSKTSMGGSGYDSPELNPGAPTIETLPPEKRAEFENNRDYKSGIINIMTNGLTTLVPSDIKSLHLVSSVVSSLTNSFDCLNRQSQWQISVKLNHLADDFNKMQDTAQRRDIIDIGSNLLVANFQTDSATNIQISEGINRDIKYSKDNFLDYDTNLESSYNSYMDVPDAAAASYSLTRETNSNFQSKIALGVGSNSQYTISSVTKVMRDILVIDERPTTIKTPYFQYFASKTTMSNVSNQIYKTGRSNFKLPDVCQLMGISGKNCSDFNNPIGLEIMATPNNVRSFLSNPNNKGLPIPVASDFVTLNMFVGNRKDEAPIQPKGTGNFTIMIGRDPMFPIPAFNFSEPNPKIDPPRIIPGTGSVFTGPETYEQKLVVFQFVLKGTDQSVHFQMKFNYSASECTQYLVVGRLGSPPVLNLSPDGVADPVNFTFWSMIPTHTKYCATNASPEEPDPFTFFVDNAMFNKSKTEVLKTQPDYSKTLDTLYFGVRELLKDEWDSYTQSNRPPTPYLRSGQINTTFRTRIFSSGCYFYSNSSQRGWGTAGCTVGPLTTTNQTQCICNHLTSFAGGWVVAPNTIDFNYVFSNFDFTKNLTLFVTEIVIFLVFLLIFIWARRQDIRDLEKVGVTPLASNDSEDQYLYEVIVDTSIRANAGTSSNVYFILSGEADETDPRHLVDAKRPILKRGNVDRFLLAVPRPLGTLQYIRLWHDNTGKGKNASWYCNYFGVTDLQTKEKTHFIVNNWFAVEENDGQIDRLIAVAGIDEMVKFQELFTRKMKTNLSEDHLWLSILARPPESRFTRVERVACCLLLLFLTMLTTCMFYQKEGPSKAQSAVLTVGPFAITPREVWTGLISNVIAFVPLFIIIGLFRKAQLKHGHANKLRQAVEDQLQISMDSKDNKGYQGSTITLTRNDNFDISRSNTPIGHNAGEGQAPDYDNTSSAELVEDVEKSKVIRKRLLPWWTRIFVWIFLVIVLIVAAFFTTLYGIQFGDMACKKWISSMFISFFTSILLTQPIKVMLLAMFFALIFKKSSLLNNIEFIDEEEELMNELGKRNALLMNEEYMHNELYTAPMKPRRFVARPPPKEELEKARELRLKELQMYDIFREIVFYLIFFCTLIFITYSFRDPNAFLLQSELTKMFIKPANGDWQFSGIQREEQFWTWALNVLVPGLRAQVWYNNNPPLYQRGFIGNRNNRLIGYAILRQVRAKKNTCKVFNYVKPLVKNCYSDYSILNEDKGKYGKRWEPVGPNVTVDPAFEYVDKKILPYLGRIGVYSGGGFVYEFRSNVTNIYRDINYLKDNNWIDFQTRAILIEFTTYNPNINLFAINTYVLELPGTGSMWSVWRVEPANLLALYSGGVKALEMVAHVFYAIFILIMIIKELRNLKKEKWSYFFQFWNLCEIFIIFGSFAAVAGFVYVTSATNKLTTEFNHYGGNVYLNFSVVAFWNENLGYLISFIVFVSTLKFIKLLRFNRRIGMLGAVLSYCGRDMRQFFIIFTITFMAFVMVFYSLFMDSLYRYHTLLFATEASMQIALGKFAFLELYQREPIFGPIVFACYVLFIIFVLLNMFIAILNEGFAAVKADIELQGNDHEMVQFAMAKFVTWTGIGGTKLGRKLIKSRITDQIYRDIDGRDLTSKIDEFPDKIEQLLNHFNRIIYDGKKPPTSREKSFSSILFDRPKPIVRGADENHEASRPISAASSNIIRPRTASQMTPIDQ